MSPAPNQPPANCTLGLIGYPLGHSLSPQIHNAALRALGLKGRYELYPVHPQGGEDLAALLQQVRSGEILGLNVTIPHKQNVIGLADELTPAAKAIGAVNTLYTRDGKLYGDNTDAPGFWADFSQRLNPNPSKSHQALILGAGGSARAVAYALLERGFQLTIAARRVAQAGELCRQFSGYKDRLAGIDFKGKAPIWQQAGYIINTTPVGMHPKVEACPWPEGLPFPPGAAIYDLVYNPAETVLLKRGRGAGLMAVNGLGMLIEQAALAFECWTGLEAPRPVMIESISGVPT